MYRYLLPAIIAFAMTLGLTQLARAEASADHATLIVYRADESFATEALRFDVHANQHFVGRLKAEKAGIIKAPAGKYILDTSIPGAQVLEIDLKPGAVHYVHSQLKLDGNSVDVQLVEVAEQVARTHGAEVFAGAI